jgi:hypothetical protein
MKAALWLLCGLLLIGAAMAVPVTYTITLSGKNITVTQHEEVREQCSLDESNATVCVNATVLVNQTQEQPWSVAIVVDDDCEDTCLDAIPLPRLPDSIVLTRAKIEEDAAGYDVTFKRSKTRSTSDLEDKIKIDILGPTCTEDTCDSACARCVDGSCHPPGYACPAASSYLEVQKVVPKNLTIGENQVNVLVKSLFGEAIADITADISGFGLKTVKAIPVVSIAPGDKDYVFLTVNATQPGEHDAIIRVRATVGGEEVKVEFIDAISVQATASAPRNRTALAESIAEQRRMLKALELDYAEKKADGYQLLDIEDTIKETKGMLLKAQTALTNDDVAMADEHLAAVRFNMDDISTNLENAIKPKRSIADFMKENVFWISAMITATLGAFALFEKQRQKMDALKQRVKHLKGDETPKRAKRRKPSRKVPATAPDEPPAPPAP